MTFSEFLLRMTATITVAGLVQLPIEWIKRRVKLWRARRIIRRETRAAWDATKRREILQPTLLNKEEFERLFAEMRDAEAAKQKALEQIHLSYLRALERIARPRAATVETPWPNGRHAIAWPH